MSSNKYRSVSEDPSKEDAYELKLAMEIDERVKKGEEKVYKGDHALKKLLLG